MKNRSQKSGASIVLSMVRPQIKNGVAILFCNNFEFTVHNIIRGNNGSFLILDITFLKKRLTLVNVYGPSGTDSPTFYEHLFNEIETLGNDDIIAAGDSLTIN